MGGGKTSKAIVSYLKQSIRENSGANDFSYEHDPNKHVTWKDFQEYMRNAGRWVGSGITAYNNSPAWFKQGVNSVFDYFMGTTPANLPLDMSPLIQF